MLKNKTTKQHTTTTDAHHSKVKARQKVLQEVLDRTTDANLEPDSMDQAPSTVCPTEHLLPWPSLHEKTQVNGTTT